MHKFLLSLGFAFLLSASPALAQNVQCADRPSGDSSNACANTRFVQQHGGGGGGTPGGNNGDIQYNNAGSFGGYPQVPVAKGGTGNSTFSSGDPLVGNGTSPVTSGTRTGNTTQFVSASGSANAGVCITYDGSGNAISSTTACAIYNSTSDIAGISNRAAGQLAYLSQSPRQGVFVWFDTDVSSYVAPRSFTSSSINTGTGVITTSTNHRLKTGDSILATSTVDGLVNNTRYYAIRLTANTLKVASTYANALAGTAITLTGTSTITFKVSPDSLQCTVIIPTGGALDGTGGAWLRVDAVNNKVIPAQACGLNVGDTNDNSQYINVALDIVSEAGGGRVTLPAGSIYMINSIYPRRYTYLDGQGIQATLLDYNDNTSGCNIDAQDDGTDGVYPYDRTIFSVSNLTLDGSHEGVSSTRKGLCLTNNMRSYPLNNVRIYNVPGTGIAFTGQNWNLSFYNVQIDTAGHRDTSTTTSSGIWTDPNLSFLADITFYSLMVEGCGHNGSTAGGMQLNFATQQARGFQFTNSQFEGNFGTDEVWIFNAVGVYIDNMYVERTSTVGGVNNTGFEITSSTGHIHGLQIYTDSGAGHNALTFKGNSLFTLMNADFGFLWPVTVETRDTSNVGYYGISGTLNNIVGTGTTFHAF